MTSTGVPSNLSCGRRTAFNSKLSTTALPNKISGMKIQKIILNFTHSAAESGQTLPQWQAEWEIVPSLLNNAAFILQDKVIQHEKRIKEEHFAGCKGEIELSYRSGENPTILYSNIPRTLPFFSVMETILGFNVSKIKEAELETLGKAEISRLEGKMTLKVHFIVEVLKASNPARPWPPPTRPGHDVARPGSSRSAVYSDGGLDEDTDPCGSGSMQRRTRKIDPGKLREVISEYYPMDRTSGEYISISRLTAWTADETDNANAMWQRCFPVLKCIQDLHAINQHKRYGMSIQEIQKLIMEHIKQFNKNLRVASEETKKKHRATAQEWYGKYGTLYEENIVPGNWPSSYAAVKSLFYAEEPVDTEVRSAGGNDNNFTGVLDAETSTGATNDMELQHLRGGGVALHLKPKVIKGVKRKRGKGTIRGPSRLGVEVAKAARKTSSKGFGTNSRRRQIEQEESDDSLSREEEEDSDSSQ